MKLLSVSVVRIRESPYYRGSQYVACITELLTA